MQRLREIKKKQTSFQPTDKEIPKVCSKKQHLSNSQNELQKKISRIETFFNAKATYLTPDTWIIHSRNIFPASSIFFNTLWGLKPVERPSGNICGKDVIFPRFTRAFIRNYDFAGSLNKSMPLPECLKWITPIMDQCEVNGVLLNWYDSDDYIGPHSDDEKDLVKGHPIISISLCDSMEHFRRFRLRSRTNGDSTVLDLKNGDIVIMGGNCQKTHKHEIMKSRKKYSNERKGRRINITLRKFSNIHLHEDKL